MHNKPAIELVQIKKEVFQGSELSKAEWARRSRVTSPVPEIDMHEFECFAVATEIPRSIIELEMIAIVP